MDRQLACCPCRRCRRWTIATPSSTRGSRRNWRRQWQASLLNTRLCLVPRKGHRTLCEVKWFRLRSEWLLFCSWRLSQLLSIGLHATFNLAYENFIMIHNVKVFMSFLDVGWASKQISTWGWRKCRSQQTAGCFICWQGSWFRWTAVTKGWLTLLSFALLTPSWRSANDWLIWIHIDWYCYNHCCILVNTGTIMVVERYYMIFWMTNLFAC